MGRKTVPAWAIAELARSLPPGAPATNIRRHTRRVVLANTRLGAVVVSKPLLRSASMRLLPNPREAIRFTCPGCKRKVEFRNLSLPALVHCGHCGRRYSLDTRGEVGPPEAKAHASLTPSAPESGPAAAPAPLGHAPVQGKTPAMVAREAFEAARQSPAGPVEAVRGQVELRAKALALAETRLHAEERRLASMKTTFVNAASHELQTPMTPLMLSLNQLQGQAGTGADRDAVQRAIRNAKRLELVISSLVKVAQVQAGQLACAPVEADVNGIVREAVAAAQPRADASGVTLAMGYARPRRAPVDAGLLRDALGHLLANAIRFTPPGGRIDVRVRTPADGRGRRGLRGLAARRAGAGSGAVEIAVRDSGCGIAAADLERVFEPFVQLDAAAFQTEGGLGLGLYFARAIAVAHGGSLVAASDGPGQGCTFTLRFPNPTTPRTTP